jgi:two-component system alkaline phosphatase synthesis response regulator PhoP
MTSERIIIIEDEADILEVLEFNLAEEGYDVVGSQLGEQGLSLVRYDHPDLLVLDLMLPDMDGLEICRQLKADPATSRIPIVMVTAKGKESDIVLGLGLGADDYVTKPFSVAEVVARVKAVLRRAGAAVGARAAEPLVHDGVVIDAARHEVSVDGKSISLTATEFRLLYYLALHHGRVFTREHLVNQIVGDEVTVLDRNVDVHIGSLRRKLGKYRELIETIWAIGYRFRGAGD